MTKRRIPEFAAAFELPREEAWDVVVRRERDRPCIRLKRLHEHTAGRIAAAPSRQLGQELERALLGAEIRKSKSGVGVDDGGERNPREVVALCNHLCSHENGAIGCCEA